MRAFLLIICTLCLSLSTAIAQQGDPKAKAILANVTKKINTIKNIKASFSLNLSSANNKVKETKKGQIQLKGNKYRVAIGGQEIICDNKTVWTYVKDANEVQISSYNPAEQTISPAKLFTNFYDKEYNYKYLGVRMSQNKKCDAIELIPISKGKQFAKIEILIDQATSLIIGGNVFEKNGNRIQYDVTSFVPNAPLADALFSFDAKKYPNVETVDLR
ncbi:MAG: outer membrane lipoprotein carrier protein LolA [Bacteroidota bacterium]|jgi:outer membrane lipoprotein carrier protein|nr:outer membrane lipoprotein carrier protein LolA [Bacteroidota bacterium]